MKSKMLVALSIIAVALALLGVSGRILAAPPRPGGTSEVSIAGGIAVADTVRSGFSYQGRLTDGTGTTLDGQYDMVFQFWDAETDGSQVGSDIAVPNVDVDNGLFNLTIDVPYEFFDGTALWLRVKVGDEWLDPPQEILPVPYALSLWPGADVRGSASAPYSIFAAINEGSGNGLSGWNEGDGEGIGGYSVNGSGVYGRTWGDDALSDAGVRGYSTYADTIGVLGESEYGNGVMGRITNTANLNSATVGWNQGGGIGVAGYSDNNYGVYGSGATYGVAAPDGMLAPTFDVGNPDVAEYFPTVVPGLEPGDVAVIAPDTNGDFGLLRATQAHDTSVAGVISTEPGITLGVRDGDIMPGDNEGEVPLALVGRVPCKVDASYGAIAVGDLLTTSPTPGHAMRCDDRVACIGAIIGKSLEPLEEGTGVILVLVTLQ